MALKVELQVVGQAEIYPIFPVQSIPCGAITENQSLEFNVYVDSEAGLPDVELAINDVPAPRTRRRGSFVFHFDTEFFAGDLRASIFINKKIVASVELEIDPAKAKLTREEYAALISEIARDTQALYRLGRVTMPASTSLVAKRNIVVTMELIRIKFERFERAVARISSQPVRHLETIHRDVPAHRIRKLSDQSVRKALQSKNLRPATARELKTAPNLVRALNGRWSPTLTEKRRNETLSLYENRAILGFIRWLRSTLTALSARLSTPVEQEIPPETVKIWQERITRWRYALTSLERQNIFSDLVPTNSLRATSIFRMHPDYSTAFSSMMKMRAGLAPGSSQIPSIPIDKTYQLYELWCYVGVLAAAARSFPECAPHIGKVLEGSTTGKILGITLLSGDVGRIHLGDGIYLEYQKRVCPQPPKGGLRTLLVEAIPDISFVRVDSHGFEQGATLLDPKYRSGSSLSSGIKDLHAYRDSILDHRGQPAVRAAIVLTPRSSGFPTSSGAWPNQAPAIVIARPKHDPTLFDTLVTRSIQSLVG